MMHLALFSVYLWLGHLPLPIGDHLDWVDLFVSEGRPLEQLWTQHNEHRLVIPKGLVFLDVIWFRGLLYPITAFMVAMFAVAAALMFAQFRGACRDTAIFQIVAAILCLLIFRTYLLPVFVGPVRAQFLLVCVFAVVSLSFLGRCERSASGLDGKFVLFVFFAILASLSMVNGLLLWPIAVWMAWLRDLRRGHIAVVAIIGAAVITCYLVGYHRTPNHPDPMEALSRVPLILEFLIHYFGTPWVRRPELLPVGAGLGVATLLVGTGLIAIKGFVRPTDRPLEVFALGLLTFALGTAMMTALGRAGFISLLTQATRYGIFTAMAQAALLCFLVRPLADRWHVATVRRTVCCLAVVAAMVLFAEQIFIGNLVVQRAAQIADVKRGLAGDVVTERMLARIHPRWSQAERAVSVLKKHRLYVYK